MSEIVRYARVGAFYGLVVIGTVLSIISLLVMLELRQPPTIPDEMKPDQLYAALTSTHQQSDTRQSAPIPLALDSATVAAAANDPGPRGSALVTYYGVQQELVEAWKARRSALVAEAEEAAEAASLTYAAEAKRPGDSDRLRRFIAIRHWHYRQTRRADAYLDSARSRLGDVNEALLALRDAREPTEVGARITEVRGRVRAAQQLLAQSRAFDPLPARPEVPLLSTDGRSIAFRPFAAPSDWLRTQQSSELASIIGMLGFGLLGAAASSVVRAPRDRKRKLRIGHNLTSLVVSGTTAAFATYLAVKGSLAVVSTDGAEPNPYVLLLTCFVAAVYWEDAWERVRKAVRRDEPDADDEPPAEDGDVREKVPVPALVGEKAGA